MKPIVLAIVAFIVSAPAHGAEGIVVLEATPGCDRFIVETTMGYSLLEWYSGVASIFQGDHVFGSLNNYGFTTIDVQGRGEMKVWVEDFMASGDDASAYFYAECR